MKSFSSVTDFINYYNNKQKMPSSVSITINGSEHTFMKSSSHSIDKITKRHMDRYSFIEKENYGLCIELSVNYYRYFEAKVILEAYFTFYHEENILFLSPIYFHNSFVSDDDFNHCIDSVSDSLEKWTGLKWVNVNQSPNAFMEIRANAYKSVQKDLFYELPGYVYGTGDDELDSTTKYIIDEKRKKKWLMEEGGESPYFNQPLEVPDFW